MMTPWIKSAAKLAAMAALALLVPVKNAEAAVLIDPATLNGSFEAGTSTVPSTWITAPTYTASAQRQNNYAQNGSWSAVLGNSAATSGTAVTLAVDTSYSVQTGDVFSLSFYLRGAFQATSTSQIGYRLFYTDTNAMGGVATDLLSGSVLLTGATGDIATSTYNLSSFNSSSAAAAAAGKTLFLSFTPGSGLDNNKFARIDTVSLNVASVPEPSTYALLGLGLGSLILLRIGRRGKNLL